MSTTTSIMARRRHTDLQPLATSQDLTHSSQGRGSLPSSITLNNTSDLPSPSMLAARAWFLETSSPIGQPFNGIQRRRNLLEAQEFPRRHSALSSPSGLTKKMSSFTVSSPDIKTEVVQHTAETEPEATLQPLKSVPVTEIEQNDLVKVTAITTGVKSRPDTSPVVAGFLARVPFEYIRARLRDWGYAYLGNIATADAFINAVSLRRHSLALVKDNNREDRRQSTAMVTIRARVHPKAKERKPFLIQRQFDIEELRASTSAVQRPAERISKPLRRSSRARRFSTQQERNTRPRRGSLGKSSEILTLLGKGAVPIHIEYALHFLPVLAALLLSGHVRRGDTVDLPVPCPEAWKAMVMHIYTGSGEFSAGVKDNIMYLAGNAG